jgi:hypothetical protein
LLSINKRYQLPKVHFLFFQFFLKAAIGNATWKKRLEDEETRLATQAIEAYTNAVVNNHYFAFLYIYFMKNPNSTLRTEYDELPQVSQTQATAATGGNIRGGEVQQETRTAAATHKLFCADLDFVEVSVPGSAATGDATTREQDDFKLLPAPPNEDGESDERKSVREHDEIIAKEIKDLIDADRLGGNGDGSSRLSSYNLMKSKLQDDHRTMLSARTQADKKRAQQKSRVSKTSLREFTKASRKSKKDGDVIMGWTHQGKRYMQDMKRVIHEEERRGIRKKWEAVYKKMCKAVEVNEEDGLMEDEVSEPFEMEESLMYSDFVEV